MGLRDRYLSSLVARCVVAVPREAQHATTDPDLAIAANLCALHATNDATTTQQAQQAHYEAKVERSAILSADGMPCWEADELAGLPKWTDAEIVTFEKRVARSTWLGYPDAEGRAERLLRRDRDHDDRRLCIECLHAAPGWRCAKRDAFMLDQLQRCQNFEGKT